MRPRSLRAREIREILVLLIRKDLIKHSDAAVCLDVIAAAIRRRGGQAGSGGTADIIASAFQNQVHELPQF
jgi:hypothetical protein